MLKICYNIYRKIKRDNKEIDNMIKYPNCKEVNCNYDEDVIKFFPVIKCTSIKQFIKAGVVTVGSKFVVDGRDITCIHHKGNQWFFQYDDCPMASTAESGALEKALKKIWNEVIPECLKKEIKYTFVPTEFQIFGENKWGVKETDTYQFDYYKNNEAHHVKNYRGPKPKHDFWKSGESCGWWLSTVASGPSAYCCLVNTYGYANYADASSSSGVPVCFLIEVDD